MKIISCLWHHLQNLTLILVFVALGASGGETSSLGTTLAIGGSSPDGRSASARELVLETGGGGAVADPPASVQAPKISASPDTYTISGVVKVGAAGLGGVTVQLTSPTPEGFTPRTFITDDTGNYSFTDLPTGRTFVVMPLKANYKFAPASQNITELSADEMLPDFDATLKLYSISGRVRAGTSTPLGDVTMTLTSPTPAGFSPRRVTTQSDGLYSFTGLPAGRNYTLTPSKTNYTFSPRFYVELSGNQTQQNISGTLKTYRIGGIVKTLDVALSHVTMILTSPSPRGFAPRTIVTTGTGRYLFTDLPAGRNYTLTPLESNYSFAPANQAYVNLSVNQTGQDFSGTPYHYSISGKILAANPATNVDGVRLTLTGDADFVPRTITAQAANGYAFDDLLPERTYTVTPSKDNYTFTPPSRTFTNLSANQTLRNFLAAVKMHTISGQVKLDGAALNGVAVRLTSLAADGFTPRKIMTDASGRYRFDDVPEGRSYAVSPSNQRYIFTPFNAVLSDLHASETADFTATAATSYYIGGQVNAGATSLSGVLIKLSGTRRGTATTDDQGNYVFGSLPVNGDYTVTVSKDNYTFTPESRDYPALSANKKLQNFDARLETVAISGQLPLRGVTVSLSGAANRTAITDSNGAYSFTNLTVGGDYTVTVSKENYTFDPSNQSFNDLREYRTADFAVATGPPHVLEFDGSLQKVDYGNFWSADVDLGHFFWEFWAMPGKNTGSRYLVSDGYGGAHALLFGFYGPLEATHAYTMGGNVFDGARSTSFGSDEGPAPNEWGHYAVGWDGANIVVYYDGVPVGKTPWNGPRRTLGHSGGGGRLSVGGSTHQNFEGRMAEVRAFEGFNPLEDESGTGLSLSTFTPQTIFDSGGFFGHSSSLMSRFTHPVRPVVDLSGENHTGLLKGNPPPQFIIDPSAPTASNAGSATTRDAPVPAASIPTGALIFDSFSRRNSTYAFDGQGGLGETEGDTTTPLVWRYSEQGNEKAPFGVLNGRAVILARHASAAWVETVNASANLEIRVDRHPGKWDSGVSTGLVFRVQDAENFFSAYTTGASAATQRLYVSHAAGALTTTIAGGVAMPAHWVTLRVVTLSAGDIKVYADSRLVYSTRSSVLANATGAGLWNWGSGQGLANRWDNFTVLNVP